MIVDNSPTCYLFHPQNAVPITSWFDDKNDTELLELIPFLQEIKDVSDVRAVLDMSE
jgi:RNA polymerase II subunit A small phosphatase-like protein